MNKIFQKIAVVVFMSIATISFQAMAQHHGGGGGHGGGGHGGGGGGHMSGGGHSGGFGGGHAGGGGHANFGGNHGGISGGGHSSRPFAARPSGHVSRPVAHGTFNRQAAVHRSVSRPTARGSFNRRPVAGLHNRTVVNNYHRTVVNRGYVRGGYYGHSSARYYHPSRPISLFGRPHFGYRYHPYRPYYWGASWHPFGFFAGSLASAAIILSFNRHPYHYYNGVYYDSYNGGYRAIAPPIGISINALPPGYDEIPVDGVNYYYYGGIYYRNYGSDYRVVTAPFGAVVYNLPEGAEQTTINGNVYMVYNNTYYQPIDDNGQNAYEVVDIRVQ